MEVQLKLSGNPMPLSIQIQANEARNVDSCHCTLTFAWLILRKSYKKAINSAALLVPSQKLVTTAVLESTASMKCWDFPSKLLCCMHTNSLLRFFTIYICL
jgi:hypothetical protein